VSGYREFIEGKHLDLKSYGFDVEPNHVNQHAFEWQKNVIRWALKRGRAALFLDTGLGKTLCQLSWAENVCRETGGSVLLHCPVGVRWQTAKEAEKFGIECPVVVGSLRLDRKFVGFELKPEYFDVACKNLRIEEQKMKTPSLFDEIEDEELIEETA
jgi:hypothetical protein